MLRFAFRSPYGHRIAPSRRDWGGGEEDGKKLDSTHNATQFCQDVAAHRGGRRSRLGVSAIESARSVVY